MRNIGIKGIECLEGPCNPWSKYICRSCAIRPMKVYQGNGNRFLDRVICQQQGFGIMISPGGASTPEHFPYYAIDNGAFSAWVNNKEWDSKKFLSMLNRLKQKAVPDFTVCPDKIAKGIDSLEFSLAWLRDLPDGRYYLAVQDGMRIEDVDPYIEQFSGLFVGGSMEWKLATTPEWITLAHKHQMPCHVGRIGTWSRIIWAVRMGVDSIDSTSWAHNDSYHHLIYARMQQTLQEECDKVD